MLNIVSNAAQILAHQEHGNITIRTRTVHQANIHGKRCKLAARVEITDNGPGIPPELQDTLFYPMVSGREGGTGLGLSISQNLIDQHNGKSTLKAGLATPLYNLFADLTSRMDFVERQFTVLLQGLVHE